MTSIIYEDIKAAAPTGFTKQVSDCLSQVYGKENGLTLEEIGIKTRGKYNETINRQTRDAIADLIEIHGQDIVSTTSWVIEETVNGKKKRKAKGGYYHPATIEELEENIRDHSSRIEHLKDRRESLYRSAARRFKVVYPDMKSQDALFPNIEVIMVDPIADPEAELVQVEMFPETKLFFNDRVRKR